MSLRALALVIPLTLTLASAPAWADISDGGDGADGADGADGGDGGDTAEEEDDKGCSQVPTPVTGLSLVIGAALALGLRRRG
jgi:hypothetical protein